MLFVENATDKVEYDYYNEAISAFNVLSEHFDVYFYLADYHAVTNSTKEEMKDEFRANGINVGHLHYINAAPSEFSEAIFNQEATGEAGPIVLFEEMVRIGIPQFNLKTTDNVIILSNFVHSRPFVEAYKNVLVKIDSPLSLEDTVQIINSLS